MPDSIITDPNVAAPVADAPDPGTAAPASSVVSEPWSKGFFGDDGSINAKVFDKAPEDLRPLAKDIERFKTADDFFKAYNEQKSLLGKKGFIEPPGEKATEVERKAYADQVRKINGAPEKPEGYALAKPEGLPDTMWNADLASHVAKIAHEEGASPKLIQKIAAAQIQAFQKDAEAVKVAEAQWFEGQDKLIREAAGKDGLEYGKAKDLAERAGRRLGIDPSNPVMKNASVFGALMRAAKMMSEDTLISGDTTGTGLSGNVTAESAKKSYDAIMTDKNNPDYKVYWNRDKKEKPADVDAIRAKVRKLQEIAHKG